MADPSVAAVARLLSALEARDLDAVAESFTPGARYANVPHPPAVGREQIREMLAPILTRSSAVRWDVVTAAYQPARAFLERVDRFWIDGIEYAVACNGVYEIDAASGLIAEVRDYVDLHPWRQRLADAGL